MLLVQTNRRILNHFSQNRGETSCYDHEAETTVNRLCLVLTWQEENRLIEKKKQIQ